jgi:hypothetical protein
MIVWRSTDISQAGTRRLGIATSGLIAFGAMADKVSALGFELSRFVDIHSTSVCRWIGDCHSLTVTMPCRFSNDRSSILVGWKKWVNVKRCSRVSIVPRFYGSLKNIGLKCCAEFVSSCSIRPFVALLLRCLLVIEVGLQIS